ncbi:hypothetical protein SpCBS45565_g08517, partial [Spizellomyces sp. 'palustris']
MPLSQLQSGKNPWQWKDKEKAAFKKIKHAITTTPILVTFDPTKDTFIFTDSSGFAIGGWLAQTTDPEDEIPSLLPKTIRELKALPRLRPVSFYSRKMKPAEMRYPVHEQELLALVKFLKHNRPYLIGIFFHAFTDHKSLIYLQTQPHLSQRQAGWVETLQQFDMAIEYMPGQINHVTDILSRNPHYAPRCAECQQRMQLQAIL